MFDTPFIIPVVAIICWAVVSVVRAKHGYPDIPPGGEWDENGKPVHTPPMFNKLLEKAMAERDAQIQSLKERIIVLEKIVTDSHKTHRLSEEIEKLRERS